LEGEKKRREKKSGLSQHQSKPIRTVRAVSTATRMILISGEKAKMTSVEIYIFTDTSAHSTENFFKKTTTLDLMSIWVERS